MALSFEQMRAAIRAALTAMLGDPTATRALPGKSPGAGGHVPGPRHRLQGREDVGLPVTFSAAGDLQRSALPSRWRSTTNPSAKAGAASSARCPRRRASPRLPLGRRRHRGRHQQNRNRYRPEVLEAAAPLYEGARCFWNHSESMGARDARDIAGFISDVRFGVIEGRRQRHAVMGVLNVTSRSSAPASWEAHRLGKPDLYRLSHDARPTSTKAVSLPEGVVRDVEGIAEVVSVDVVSHPAAGGRVVRLVAGAVVGDSQEDLQMFEQKLKRLRESRPDLAARLSANPTEPGWTRSCWEAVVPAPAPVAPPRPLLPPRLRPASPSPRPTRSFRAAMHELRVDKALSGRTLPEAQRVALRESLLARQGISDAELSLEVDRWVKAASQTAAPLPEPPAPARAHRRERGGPGRQAGRGPGRLLLRQPEAEAQATYREQNGGKAPKDGFRSYREAYVEITGDRKFTGSLHEAVGLRRFENRVSEALTSASWAQIQGDSIRRALLADYGTQVELDRWRDIVSNIGSISDFRTNRRMRMGGYGNLATVNEAGTTTR